MALQPKVSIPVEVWIKGRVIPGYDANMWRHDDFGAVIKFGAYGDRQSDERLGIDHIVPVSRGGSDQSPTFGRFNTGSTPGSAAPSAVGRSAETII